MKTTPKELSWFKLSLLHFLYESHPELTDDNDLLNTRSDLAAECYSQAVKNGHNHQEAEELAHKELYKGLHFSKHDTLVTIIWNEFPGIIPLEEAKEFAVRFLPEAVPVFEKYRLNDEFAFSSEFNDLYTELTGAIEIWLEEHEL
ncbi:DUF1896 family protein [Draconibacterium sp. IB214405]|uniref:DUF1896 family protein n=1 Tax=Draconibacterium sp. IB214405 TaxID=3097352 RepID=UPI002A14F3AE|nr:DUF1896 family protein [Draconibacterium sp. IB214405]MDX8341687.1 DUF1896 family protein [Draconibacterium sp. IB214405]